MSGKVLNLVDVTGNVPKALENAAGRARLQLDAFSNGQKFVFAMNPHNKSVTAKIARTGPVELGILDVRVTDPKPQLRIFVCVPFKDTLIALTWEERGIIDKLFGTYVRHAQKEWKALFPNHEPLVSANSDDYFSDIILG